ncbi:hypothetical protein LXA43DRAFT_1103582 [Ganoderma leucocontextum]|nr:hypothetical protein LXA43DRAFT_1103582 [Ganoderma leucocontextum]
MPLSQIISQVLMNPDEEDVPAETQLSIWVDNLSSPSYGYNIQRTCAVIEGFWSTFKPFRHGFRPRASTPTSYGSTTSSPTKRKPSGHVLTSSFFTWLRNFAWHRLLALGVVGMEVDLSQHEEFVENYIQQRQLMAERAAESMQALADAEADHTSLLIL